MRRLRFHLLKDQQGAATIEALGLTVMMVFLLIAIIFIGSAFWNLTLLNSAAQTSSLASQTIIDRECTHPDYVTADCGEVQLEAEGVVRQMIESPGDEGAALENQLIMVPDGSLNYQLNREPATCDGTSLPVSGADLPSGWGYSGVQISADFAPFENFGTMNVNSVSTTYRPGC